MGGILRRLSIKYEEPESKGDYKDISEAKIHKSYLHEAAESAKTYMASGARDTFYEAISSYRENRFSSPESPALHTLDMLTYLVDDYRNAQKMGKAIEKADPEYAPAYDVNDTRLLTSALKKYLGIKVKKSKWDNYAHYAHANSPNTYFNLSE
ncbi:Uncharacterised protein [uncultured archaeon]|nr:Uncharacterised protein [uncultured archaeon]